jgi:hypothetical protein
LILDKKLDFSNINIERLGNGSRALRQKIQIEYTLMNKEWKREHLKDEISNWRYPLHFIDFETTRTALPFRKGMRPFEVIIFQWSCHTIYEPGATPVHSEWICLEPIFPNFLFAESLMKTIGTEGTVLIWSPYENTMLRTIYNQYIKYDYDNEALLAWLDYLVKFDKNDVGKLLDMNKIALDSYFHPAMKGRTSIKSTLPAVLQASKNIVEIERLLENFEDELSLLKKDDNGYIMDPYKLLPTIELFEKAETIEDGTGAMRAYEDIMFGLRKGNLEELVKYRQGLLRYCKLDTLAMVIIWEYWSI